MQPGLIATAELTWSLDVHGVPCQLQIVLPWAAVFRLCLLECDVWGPQLGEPERKIHRSFHTLARSVHSATLGPDQLHPVAACGQALACFRWDCPSK